MPFILLLIGLILLVLEFFSSGGFFAVLGGAFVVASVIWAGYVTMAVLPTVVFALVCLAAVSAIVRFGRRCILPRMRVEDEEGAPLDERLIGSRGHAASDLSPSGQVKIGQALYPAIAKNGYIKKGLAIEVIQVQMGHLVVCRL